ncbi:helix-turn-helix domain-containing protein [Ascidiimonas sp. W6]|uniref:helix-turn-helix domain-containing protein n=1 Tax=Ascidiimonas meishanensis TaxID=3128903 RepID=UPI0030EB8C82
MNWYDTFKNTKINYYLVNLSFALAPLIYFYFRAITKPKAPFTKIDSLHFIPVAILLVVKLYILIYDASQPDFSSSQNGYLVINFQWKYVDPIATLLAILQMLVYLVFSFQLLKSYREKLTHYFSNTFKIQLNWLYTFLIIYTFLYLYYSFQVVINAMIVDLSWRQEWWYYLLSGLAIIYVGIKGYFTNLDALREIELESFLHQKKNIFLPQKVKANSPLELSDGIKILKKEIEIYFATSKPFLEPDLTLVRLADALQTSREELSEAINKGFEMKFNDFINQYRIEEFKRKISEGKHKQLSLLGLAYECGFNSKATFNRSFKKVVASSPTEYLQGLK